MTPAGIEHVGGGNAVFVHVYAWRNPPSRCKKRIRPVADKLRKRINDLPRLTPSPHARSRLIHTS